MVPLRSYNSDSRNDILKQKSFSPRLNKASGSKVDKTFGIKLDRVTVFCTVELDHSYQVKALFQVL